MGLFRNIVDAALDANETAHGKRLHAEFLDTLRVLSGMDRSIADEAIARFVAKRAKLVQPMKNWTNDGKIQMANTLKREARKTLDMNMVEGYALWFTSAWLEASVRPAAMAQDVFAQLDQLSKEHERAAEIEARGRTFSTESHATLDYSDPGDVRAAQARHQPDSRLRRPQSLEDQILVMLPEIHQRRASGHVPVLLGAIREFFNDSFDRVDGHQWNFAFQSSTISQSTAVARVAGMAMAVAHSSRDQADPLEVLCFALKYLHSAGISLRFANATFFGAIEEYTPHPTTVAGADALIGAEIMRRYLDGEDDEIDISALSRSGT